RPTGLQPLAHDLQPEVIQPSERGQVRASEGSVRHVEVFPVGGVGTPIIGRPRPLSDERRADADARVNTATSTPWIRKSLNTARAAARTRAWALAGEHAPDHATSAKAPLIIDVDAT